MHKAFKFRLYPTKEQATLINKSIGCSRFVFNHFLAKWNETYEQTAKGLTYTSCSKLLTALKKEIEWLGEVDSTSLQRALKNVNDAFKRFFKKQNDKPRFKSRRNKVQSYTSQCNRPKKGKSTIEVMGNKIKLPKLGQVRFAKSREVEGKILSATIRRNPSGTYFVSILCERNHCPYVPAKNKAVGIDLGLKDFAILSDGAKVKPNRFFRQYEQKLAKVQRMMFRRTNDKKKVITFCSGCYKSNANLGKLNRTNRYEQRETFGMMNILPINEVMTSLLKFFIPNMFVPSIYQIDLNALKQKGVNSIIVDLDNTLVEAERPDATPQLLDWLSVLKQHQFKVIIVSNNSKSRVTEFAIPLELPYIYMARKPLSVAFQQAMEMMGSERKQTVVVGDQLLTDVLGGNRMGIYTILVVPVSKREGVMTRINRRLERLIFWWLRRKGYLKRGDVVE